MSVLLLTDRALGDLAAIEDYSARQFGQKAAQKYLRRFDAAFTRLRESPEMLTHRPDLSGRLRFYRVEMHLLVCDVIDGQLIILLTIKHGAMDLPQRIAELEPQLRFEAEWLARKVLAQREGDQP